jgi:hypothetical protein
VKIEAYVAADQTLRAIRLLDDNRNDVGNGVLKRLYQKLIQGWGGGSPIFVESTQTLFPNECRTSVHTVFDQMGSLGRVNYFYKSEIRKLETKGYESVPNYYIPCLGDENRSREEFWVAVD